MVELRVETDLADVPMPPPPEVRVRVGATTVPLLWVIDPPLPAVKVAEVAAVTLLLMAIEALLVPAVRLTAPLLAVMELLICKPVLALVAVRAKPATLKLLEPLPIAMLAALLASVMLILPVREALESSVEAAVLKLTVAALPDRVTVPVLALLSTYTAMGELSVMLVVELPVTIY